MKYAAAAITLLSATGALAAPAKRDTTTSTTTPARSYDSSSYEGFILPTVIKNHDVQSNLNTWDVQTATVRNGGVETSTLYEIPIPAEAAGKTCGLVFFAGRLNGGGDNILGEEAMDIFNNNIEDLSTLESGNLRNQQLARIRFDSSSNLYDFDLSAVTPRIQSFPCPAGKTLEWESVAVGDFDINVITQDFSYGGTGAPNGLSIAFW